MPRRGANIPVLTHAVMVVVVRVCGEVPTRVAVHTLSLPPVQVHLYIADTLLVVDDVVAVGAVRRWWEQTGYSARRLPRQVSQTWLLPYRTSAPVTTLMRLSGEESFGVQMISARPETGTPAHLRVMTGRVVWQVLDRTAFDRIGAALREAEAAFPIPETF